MPLGRMGQAGMSLGATRGDTRVASWAAVREVASQPFLARFSPLQRELLAPFVLFAKPRHHTEPDRWPPGPDCTADEPLLAVGIGVTFAPPANIASQSRVPYAGELRFAVFQFEALTLVGGQRPALLRGERRPGGSLAPPGSPRPPVDHAAHREREEHGQPDADGGQEIYGVPAHSSVHSSGRSRAQLFFTD